jgi:peptidoglycan-N-acetylglucosamine deacetylase
MIVKIIIVITLISLAIAGITFWSVNLLTDHGLLSYFVTISIFLLAETLLLLGTLERRFSIFGRVFWRGSKEKRAISITFDDGPNEPYTSQILDILKEQDVKATFFVIGENVSKFPETIKRELREGHEIGNHTFNHDVFPLKSPNYIHNQLKMTSDLIEEIIKIRPKLFRASHGWRNPYVNAIAKKEGLITVAWTLGVWDTDRPGADVITHRTLKSIKNGCVLLLHDGRGTEHEADSSQLVEALPVIINEAKRQGYKFLTLSEMTRDK